MSGPSGVKPRSYRFGDDTRPGVLLGLSAAQAVPIVAGVVWLAGWLQADAGPASPILGLVGLLAGVAVAFGRWRDAPLRELAGPACRFLARRAVRRQRWARPALLGTASSAPGPVEPLPPVLAGLELLDVPAGADGTSGQAEGRVAVVSDRAAGTVTGVLRLAGRGFPFLSPVDQDGTLAQWAGVLAPFAQSGSAVSRLVWQASTCSGATTAEHPPAAPAARDGQSFEGEGALVADYRALVGQQQHLGHDVLLSITVDLRRVRSRPGEPAGGGRLGRAVRVLVDEMGLLAQRLSTAGVSVTGPLTPAELTSTVRAWSDPARSTQAATLRRSLAAAACRAPLEWGPMVVEPAWGHVRVDGAWHRCFRVAAWPALAVPADWMAPLLTTADVHRTISVVMEPVDLAASARAASREAMSREADADARARRGFRVTARDRKRHHEVEAREQELAEGHPEFRFAGFVDVTGPDEAAMHAAAAVVEQAAGRSLVDLRPLDARHDLGWLACLPLGRNVANRGPGL